MIGNPGDFEAIGNRLGFRIVEESSARLRLRWQGPRFPAFLCLGMALLLLGVSIPIAQAIYLNGFESRAFSLWYFPLMNLVLFVIGIYLFAQERRIAIESGERVLVVCKRLLFKTVSIRVGFDEIESMRLGLDRVYSGFAVAGSSADQKFPVPSLRLQLRNADSVLLDRGGTRRLAELGEKLAQRLLTHLEISDEVKRLTAAR